jgi:hypothetical protein
VTLMSLFWIMSTKWFAGSRHIVADGTGDHTRVILTTYSSNVPTGHLYSDDLFINVTCLIAAAAHADSFAARAAQPPGAEDRSPDGGPQKDRYDRHSQ